MKIWSPRPVKQGEVHEPHSDRSCCGLLIYKGVIFILAAWIAALIERRVTGIFHATEARKGAMMGDLMRIYHAAGDTKTSWSRVGENFLSSAGAVPWIESHV